ncbi:hypothetical protein EU522_01875 [Candidatus Thorarchaeota archaeon]|nr:MAG: hypothetical protein EU522_01875 [Candidatus Thorarchaeota archaeon]
MSQTDSTNISKHMSRILVLLLLVALLAPHTLATMGYSHYPDEDYTRYTLIAALWSISYETGSTITGPYTTMGFAFPIDAVFVWAVAILPLSVYIIYTLKRFMRRNATKRTVLYSILALLLLQVILMGFLCYSVDGWLIGCSYPVPLFQLVSFLVVVLHKSNKKRMKRVT